MRRRFLSRCFLGSCLQNLVLIQVVQDQYVEIIGFFVKLTFDGNIMRRRGRAGLLSLISTPRHNLLQGGLIHFMNDFTVDQGVSHKTFEIPPQEGRVFTIADNVLFLVQARVMRMENAHIRPSADIQGTGFDIQDIGREQRHPR